MVKIENQDIEIPTIHLEWSSWLACHEQISQRTMVPNNPRRTAGVYEARLRSRPDRLIIGKTNCVAEMVQDALGLGEKSGEPWESIRDNEDLSQVEVRWAETTRPCAVQEELLRMHITQHKIIPKYYSST